MQTLPKENEDKKIEKVAPAPLTQTNLKSFEASFERDADEPSLKEIKEFRRALRDGDQFDGTDTALFDVLNPEQETLKKGLQVEYNENVERDESKTEKWNFEEAFKRPHLTIPNIALRHFWDTYFPTREYVRWSTWVGKLEEHLAMPSDLPATELPNFPYGYGLHKNELVLLLDDSILGSCALQCMRTVLDIEADGMVSVYSIVPIVRSAGYTCGISDPSILEQISLKHLLFLLGSMRAKVILPSINSYSNYSLIAASTLCRKYDHAVAAIADLSINRTDDDLIHYSTSLLFSPYFCASDAQHTAGGNSNLRHDEVLGPISLKQSLNSFINQGRRVTSGERSNILVVAGPRGQGTTTRIVAAVRQLLDERLQEIYALVQKSISSGGRLSVFDINIGDKAVSTFMSEDPTRLQQSSRASMATVNNSSYSTGDILSDTFHLCPMFDAIYIDLRGRITYPDILASFCSQLGLRGISCGLQSMQFYLSKLISETMRQDSLLVVDHVSLAIPGCADALKRVLNSVWNCHNPSIKEKITIIILPHLRNATPVLLSKQFACTYPELLHMKLNRLCGTTHDMKRYIDVLVEHETIVEMNCEENFLKELESVLGVLGIGNISFGSQESRRSIAKDNFPFSTTAHSDEYWLPDSLFLLTYSLSEGETSEFAHRVDFAVRKMMHSCRSTAEALPVRVDTHDQAYSIISDGVSSLDYDESMMGGASNQTLRDDTINDDVIQDQYRVDEADMKIIYALSGGVPAIIVLLIKHLAVTKVQAGRELNSLVSEFLEIYINDLRRCIEGLGVGASSSSSNPTYFPSADTMCNEKSKAREGADTMFRLPDIYSIGSAVTKRVRANCTIYSDVWVLWCALDPLLHTDDYVALLSNRHNQQEWRIDKRPSELLSVREPFIFCMDMAWKLSKRWFRVKQERSNTSGNKYRYRDWCEAWNSLINRGWIHQQEGSMAQLQSFLSLKSCETHSNSHDEILFRKSFVVWFDSGMVPCDQDYLMPSFNIEDISVENSGEAYATAVSAIRGYLHCTASCMQSVSSTLALTEQLMQVSGPSNEGLLRAQRQMLLNYEVDVSLLSHFIFVFGLILQQLSFQSLTENPASSGGPFSADESDSGPERIVRHTHSRSASKGDEGSSADSEHFLDQFCNDDKGRSTEGKTAVIRSNSNPTPFLGTDISRAISETFHNIDRVDFMSTSASTEDQNDAKDNLNSPQQLNSLGGLGQRSCISTQGDSVRIGDELALELLNLFAGSLRVISLLRMTHGWAAIAGLHLGKLCIINNDGTNAEKSFFDLYDVGNLLLNLHLRFLGMVSNSTDSGCSSSCDASIVDYANVVTREAFIKRMTKSAEQRFRGFRQKTLNGAVSSFTSHLLRKAHIYLREAAQILSAYPSTECAIKKDSWLRRVHFDLGKCSMMHSALEIRKLRNHETILKRWTSATSSQAEKYLQMACKALHIDQVYNKKELEAHMVTHYHDNLQRVIEHSPALLLHDSARDHSSDRFDGIDRSIVFPWALPLGLLNSIDQFDEKLNMYHDLILLKLNSDGNLLLAEFHNQLRMRQKLDICSTLNTKSLFSLSSAKNEYTFGEHLDGSVKRPTDSSTREAEPSTSSSHESIDKDEPNCDLQESVALEEYHHIKFPLYFHSGRIDLFEELIEEDFIYKIQATSLNEIENGSKGKENEGELLKMSANSLFTLDYLSIKSKYLNALESYRMLFGSMSQISAEVAVMTGDFLRSYGEDEAAKNLFEESLKVFKHHKIATFQLPQSVPAACWLGLASYFSRIGGKLDLTVRLYEEALSILKCLQRADHFICIVISGALIPLLKEQGNLERACHLLNQNIQSLNGRLSALRRRTNLYRHMLQSYRFKELSINRKFEMLHSAMYTFRKMFLVSRWIASSLLKLAAIHEEKKNFHLAVPLYKETIIHLREQRVVLLEEKRGMRLYRQEEAAFASENLKDAETRRELKEKQTATERTVHFDLSIQQQQVDMDGKAIESPQRASDGNIKSTTNERCPAELEVILSIAETMRKLAEALFEEGRRLLGRGSVSGKVVPDFHFRNINYIMDRAVDIYGEFDLRGEQARVAKLLVETLKQKSRYHAAQREFEEAKDCFESIMKIFMEIKFPEYEVIALAQREFARLLVQCGDYGEASMLFQQSVDIYRRKRGEMYVDREMACSLLERGSALIDCMAYDEAQPVLEDCMLMLNMLYGEEGTDGAADQEKLFAACHCQLAAVYHHFEEYAEALLEYNLAVKIYKGIGSMRNSMELANVYNNLATLHDDMGHVEDAKKSYEDAVIILFRYHDNAQAQLLVTLENLMNLLGDMGLTEEQKNVMEHIDRMEQSAERYEAEEKDRLESLNRSLYGKAIEEQENRTRLRKRYAADLHGDLQLNHDYENESSAHSKNHEVSARYSSRSSLIPDLVIQSDQIDGFESNGLSEEILDDRAIFDFHQRMIVENEHEMNMDPMADDDFEGRFDIGIDEYNEEDSWDSDLDIEMDNGDLNDVEGGRFQKESRDNIRNDVDFQNPSAQSVLNVGGMMSFLGGFNDRSALHEMRDHIGNDGTGTNKDNQPRNERHLTKNTLRRSSTQTRPATAVSAHGDEDLPAGNCVIV